MGVILSPTLATVVPSNAVCQFLFLSLYAYFLSFVEGTSYQSASSDAVQKQMKDFNLVDAIVPADVIAGLTCTPVSVLTLAGKSW